MTSSGGSARKMAICRNRRCAKTFKARLVANGLSWKEHCSPACARASFADNAFRMPTPWASRGERRNKPHRGAWIRG